MTQAKFCLKFSIAVHFFFLSNGLYFAANGWIGLNFSSTNCTLLLSVESNVYTESRWWNDEHYVIATSRVHNLKHHSEHLTPTVRANRQTTHTIHADSPSTRTVRADSQSTRTVRADSPTTRTVRADSPSTRTVRADSPTYASINM